jgi:hypothetical protein
VKVGASRLEDRLAPWEPPYKSRGEAQVGRLLDRYGIPFFYESPLNVHDGERERTWHPDFTLFSYRGLVLEYAGMPDRPDYMAGIRKKERVYAQNRIPAVFVYPQDLRGPRWPAQVIERIRDTYHASFGRKSYGATGHRWYACGAPARARYR